MSWSDIKYDPNTPNFNATLKTSVLQGNTRDIIGRSFDSCEDCDCNSHGFNCCDLTNPNFCNTSDKSEILISNATTSCYRTNEKCDIDFCYPNVRSTLYTFRGTKDQTCAAIDGQQTCSLGTCIGKLQDNKWVTSSEWPVGTAECSYIYDYANFNNTEYPQLSNWIVDLYTKTTNSAPSGMDSTVKNRIRDAVVVYALTMDFFNQIYNYDWYATKSNPFSNVDYVGSHFDGFTKNMITSFTGLIINLYSSSIFPVDLYNCLIGLLIPPIPMYTNKIYTITLNLSYNQYLAYQKTSDETGFFTNLISHLLQDTIGQVTDLELNRSWNPTNPTFQNVILGTVTAVQLVDDKTGESAYSLRTGLDPETPIPSDSIFGTIQITGQVKNWSPMLAVYFQTFNPGINFDKETCSLIYNPSGVKASPVPLRCMQNLCPPYNLQCKDVMMNYCRLYYRPPQQILQSSIENILAVANNTSCYCYTSRVAPATEFELGFPPAMCYSKYCSNDVLGMFGLTDNNCQSYCSEVYNWLHSSDPSQQCRNCQELDQNKLQRVCGPYNNQLTESKFNKEVLVGSLLCFIAITVLCVIILINRGNNYKRVGLVSVIILAFGMAISIFLGFFLAGQALCSNGKSVCRSFLTNTNIPTSFCSRQFECECMTNKDCANTCQCVSSVCQPISGNRPTTTKSITKPNPSIVTTGSVLAILLPIILIKLKPSWPKSVLIIGVILSAIVPLLVIVYQLTKKTTQIIFTGKCQGTGGVCNSQEDCIDPSTCCVGKQCLLRSDDLTCNTVSPSKSLPSGNYYIQSIAKQYIGHDNLNYPYLYPMLYRPVFISSNLDSTCIQTPQFWTYDANTYMLTGVDQSSNSISGQNTVCTMGLFDSCSFQQNSGVLYSQDINYTNPHPQFVLSSDGTIFNFESNSYIIPDTTSCDENVCPSGDCGNCVQYVTYTKDSTKAKQWIFTPCDPQTTCATGCGYCGPIGGCDLSRKCQKQIYIMTWYTYDPITKQCSDIPMYMFSGTTIGHKSTLIFKKEYTEKAMACIYNHEKQTINIWPINFFQETITGGLIYQCAKDSCPVYWTSDGDGNKFIIDTDGQVYLGYKDPFSLIVRTLYSDNAVISQGNPQSYIQMCLKLIPYMGTYQS